jgi:hypothetical protein
MGRLFYENGTRGLNVLVTTCEPFVDLHRPDQLYIVDQPSRGRSPWQQGIDGPQSQFNTLTIEQRFTATRRFKLWPQAGLHTQWPGNGSRGDETFDNFYASILPFLSSNEEASNKVQRAGVALLDKIGVRGVQLFSQESSKYLSS